MTKTLHYDVIFIGGGAIGTASFHELAKSGTKKILLLEKNSNFGRGATGAWCSLVRIYHADPEVTRLAAEAVPYYLNFQEETGRAVYFRQTGSLYFMKLQQLEHVKSQLEVINRGPLNLEILYPDKNRKRFPSFYWHPDDFAIYERYAGYVCPHESTEAWVNSGIQRGANVKTNVKVIDFIKSKGKIESVLTSDGVKYSADKFVLCTGAWTSFFQEKLGENLPLKTKIIQVNHFSRGEPTVDEPFFLDFEAQTFGRPTTQNSFLGGFVEASQEGPAPREEEVDHFQHLHLREAHEAKQRLSRRVSWLKSASLTGGTRAAVGYSEKGIGLLEYSQVHSNLLYAVAWSCTGFVLAPWVSRQVVKMLNMSSGKVGIPKVPFSTPHFTDKLEYDEKR